MTIRQKERIADKITRWGERWFGENSDNDTCCGSPLSFYFEYVHPLSELEERINKFERTTPGVAIVEFKDEGSLEKDVLALKPGFAAA